MQRLCRRNKKLLQVAKKEITYLCSEREWVSCAVQCPWTVRYNEGMHLAVLYTTTASESAIT
jgi:hypothetical protein